MPLRAGETVDFEVIVEYEIASVDVAELSITFGPFATLAEVQIQGYARETHIIKKGRSSLTVARRLWLPTGLETVISLSECGSPHQQMRRIRLVT